MANATAAGRELPIETLFVRWRDGTDPNALGALFDRTAPALFRIALSVAPDAATAEEAVQETFLAVLEDPGRCDPSQPLMPWLATVLRNKVVDARRRTRRVPDPLRLEPRILPEDPADGLARKDAIDRVRAAIDELPEPYRTVALLRWEYGLEPGEIAHARGEPPGTVRSTLSRALERLRKTLGGVAVMALVLGARPAVGLGAVRRTVLERAGLPAGAAASGVVMGGVLVSQFAAMLALGAAFVAGGIAGAGAMTLAQDRGEEAHVVAAAPSPQPSSDAPRTRVASRDRARAPDEAAPVPPSGSEQPAPGGAPSAPPAVGDAVERMLASLNGSWQNAFATGTLLTLLPEASVHSVLVERWPTLRADGDRQQILKAFAFAPRPRTLDVLDLGMKDPAPSVREWALDYLRWYSARDFADDADGYARWHASWRDKPLRDMFAAARDVLVARLSGASESEARDLADLVRLHAWLSQAHGVPQDALLSSIEAHVVRGDGSTALEFLPALCELPAPEAWFRGVFLPILDRHPAIRGGALHTLGEYRQRWAYADLVAHLDGADAASAAAGLGLLRDPRAVPELLRRLESADAARAVAYERGLAELAGVQFETPRGAAWWTDWWTKNRERLEKAAAEEAVR